MAGLEPARALTAQRILSPLRLPFRHIGKYLISTTRTTAFATDDCTTIAKYPQGFLPLTQVSLPSRRLSSLPHRSIGASNCIDAVH